MRRLISFLWGCILIAVATAVFVWVAYQTYVRGFDIKYFLGTAVVLVLHYWAAVPIGVRRIRYGLTGSALPRSDTL
jgi:predicted membrane protein